MVDISRKTSLSLTVVASRLKALEGKVAKAGWFASSRYESGMPVAAVAVIQEYGAHISRFGSKAGDYTIVIPPRPFMRPTILREQQQWLTYMASGARAILRGSLTPEQVYDGIGLRIAADIARSITLVQSPPLKPATIAARLRRRADKKTLGLLDKPLIDSGKMYGDVINSEINHRVDNA
jgi:hypothetical protein